MNAFLITHLCEYLWLCNIFFSELLNLSVIKHYPAIEHSNCISCVLLITWTYIGNSRTASDPQPEKKQSQCQNNYSKRVVYSKIHT